MQNQGELVNSMAQGAADAVKHILGMGGDNSTNDDEKKYEKS